MPHIGGKRRGTRHAKKRSSRRMRKGTRKMKGGIFGWGAPDCSCQPGYQISPQRQHCVKYAGHTGQVYDSYPRDPSCYQ